MMMVASLSCVELVCVWGLLIRQFKRLRALFNLVHSHHFFLYSSVPEHKMPPKRASTEVSNSAVRLHARPVNHYHGFSDAACGDNDNR